MPSEGAYRKHPPSARVGVRAARSRIELGGGRYMTGIRRSPTRVLAIVTTILALTALALALAPTASASSGSSARRGALHIAKECTQDTGLADSFCTITSSNLSEITVGS